MRLATFFLLSLSLVLSVVPAFAEGAPAPPTVEDARKFIEQAEERLLELWIKASRAAWVQANFITPDTQLLAADAQKDAIAAAMEHAHQATRFDSLDLPDDLERKLKLLRTSITLPAPSDPDKQAELTRLGSAMEARYGKGEYCPEEGECLDLTRMSRILAESRDPARLEDIWTGWRAVSPPMRPQYERFVELANQGARELGFADLGALWRSGYDMSPEEFSAEIERLWNQLKPLYLALHAHVRARLADHYGEEIVPRDGPVPAHLLGNMWSQSWANIYPLVAPPAGDPGYDLTELLKQNDLGPMDMVRTGERFFTSLGFAPLPDTFWERSLFTKPADRDVVCHASAWDIDQEDDLRIKMCIQVTDEDFVTIHHELGHNFYQRAYSHLSPLYRGSANDGFHEALGDTIALSVTPDYLEQIGLLEEAPESGGDLGLLMKAALDKIAFLPFAYIVDQWRWQVFSGDVKPADYNQAWWQLRTQYQGIAPPVPRTEDHFDPGAKYHIPANVPYTRYFLAYVLQFQFHRALCRQAGYRGPLHRCSIYESEAAGEKLKKMMQMGRSRPWPDALEAVTGQRRMDATAIVDYFRPLLDWLEQQNQDRPTGW